MQTTLFGTVVPVLYSSLRFYLSTMFEKATTSCIVVILFYVSFELLSLCDVMGRGGGGGGARTAKNWMK